MDQPDKVTDPNNPPAAEKYTGFLKGFISLEPDRKGHFFRAGMMAGNAFRRDRFPGPAILNPWRFRVVAPAAASFLSHQAILSAFFAAFKGSLLEAGTAGACFA